jgi:hypothetical protein
MGSRLEVDEGEIEEESEVAVTLWPLTIDTCNRIAESKARLFSRYILSTIPTSPLMQLLASKGSGMFCLTELQMGIERS